MKDHLRRCRCACFAKRAERAIASAIEIRAKRFPVLHEPWEAALTGAGGVTASNARGALHLARSLNRLRRAYGRTIC